MIKILVWGTGAIADHILENGLQGEIIGFIETKKTKNDYCGKKVYAVSEIPVNYDFIVVANSFSDEIYQICIDSNVCLDKIIFLKKLKRREGFTELKTIKKLIGDRNYVDYCNEFDLRMYSFFEEDMQKYESLKPRDNFHIHRQYIWPILKDKYALAGSINNYFWQDLWAAKLVIDSNVKNHFDVGSRIDGFIAHLLASNINVTMIDVREFPGKVERLFTIVDDATNLCQIPDESLESISALCSIEHFGLGRYGDPIDPEACFKCFDNIQRKLKKGGRLYISLPIGKERVEFNAHRVFYAQTIVDSFDTLNLKEFSCTAEGKIEYQVDIHKYDDDIHNGEYRYGLFYFEKESLS